MRVLILSCNTGEGHNSAARAVKESLERASVECEIDDALAFLSPKASNFICKWHVRLYKKAPAIFGIGYKAAEKTMPDKLDRSMLYEIMAKGAKKLAARIQEYGCESVVCTHPFAAMMLTKATMKYKVRVRSSFVATDYTCSPGVSESRMDYYFIPHKSLIGDFSGHNIPRESIIPTGIPVSRKFYSEKEPLESKNALNIPPHKKTILFMCGSMGCGPMKLIAKKLADIIKEDEFLVVICGSNIKLYKSLMKYHEENRVRIVGFTKNMPDYMNAAELMITKPGGLSTTEAAAKGLPMVLVDAVSGCETYNMRFWVENGMAKTNKNSNIALTVRELLDSPDELGKMKYRVNESFSEIAADKLCDVLLESEKVSAALK